LVKIRYIGVSACRRVGTQSLSSITTRRTFAAASVTRRYNSKGGIHALIPISATFLRGGTSKGIFCKRSISQQIVRFWDTIFLGIMGSPDSEHGRQLNGMGGQRSALWGPQKTDGIDMHTFVQVGIRDSIVDYSGNCGNFSSVIGVYAVFSAIPVSKMVVRGYDLSIKTPTRSSIPHFL